MQKKWNIVQTDAEKSRALAEAVGVSPLVAGMLLHRGIADAETAEQFLCPERQPFYDPFLLKDMDKAVQRIARAIEKQEKITVYGDYDVDGITSTALLIHHLERLGAHAEYYIPDRQAEGYGLHAEALRHLADGGTTLLISVDCGISAIEEIQDLPKGMDIVITDHHLPGKTLPNALAVVNPHREDCPYPDKNLAGVGVAFKLCQALWRRMREEDCADGLDIVALGTIADVVPLLGENRRIVKQGLEQMPHTACIGLLALIQVSGLSGAGLNAGHVGFMLAPRLNAAGRISSARKGVDLLLSRDRADADALAAELSAQNAERQAIEKKILDEAEKQLLGLDMAKQRVIVLAGEGWHPGVIGIVASRLVDKYYRPTVVISESDGMGKGSCRSIRGFHMYHALEACRELLLGFGGHAQAAGLSLETERLGEFREAMDRYAREHLTAEDYLPAIDIEFELSPHAVDFRLIEEIDRLAPYGMGNPKPLFGCHDVRGSYARPLGKDGKHLKFKIEQKDSSLDALFWRKGEYAALVNAQPLDIVYLPEINEWNGQRSIQCIIEEICPAESGRVFPVRELLGKVYLFLRGIQRAGQDIPDDGVRLTARYLESGGWISLYAMETSLRVFQEIGLLENRGGNYVLAPAPQKKLDLMDSPLYRQGACKN